MSLYEWTALISVKPIKNPLTGTPPIIEHVAETAETPPPSIHLQEHEVGRPRNATFPLASNHPLFSSHVQRIRSKSNVPISIGRMPRPPVSKPANPTTVWKRQALRFARHVLIEFQPWSDNKGTLPGPLTWYRLCVFMQELEHGRNGKGATHLDRIRRRWIQNMAHGLRINSDVRTAVQKYRSRSATVWGIPDGVLRIFGSKPPTRSTARDRQYQ